MMPDGRTVIQKKLPIRRNNVMNLAKFSRRRYTYYDTPIEYLANLTKVMGGPNIYMKQR